MRLKELRKAHALTQSQTAEILGVPTKTYQNYEREVRYPDMDVLCVLADRYGVTLDYLVGRDDSPDYADRQRLLVYFDQLDDDGQERLLELARVMVKSGEYVS